MAYPQTSVPETQHTVFYAHSIHVNGVEIGSCQSLSLSATRATERIREVLFSRGPEVKEIVWGGSDITATLTRVELYQRAMYEAFGIEIYSIEDFNQPVNITEIQFNPNNNGNRIMTYIDCVASDWSKEITQGTVQIVESVTFQVRTIRGSRSS